MTDDLFPGDDSLPDDDEDESFPGLAEPRDLAGWRDQARSLHSSPADAHPSPADDPVARLVEWARARYAEGAFQAAIGLADEALAKDRTCLAAWLCKAQCLVRLGNIDRAIAGLRTARSAVTGPDAVRKVDGVLAACVRRRTGEQIERARIALRRGRPDEAVTLLAGCLATLADDEEFGRRLTYAQDRARAVAQRRLPYASTRLTHAALQSVLDWLCADELRHAARAIEAEQFEAAAGLYRNARCLDRRYTRATLAEATALRAHCAATQRPESNEDVARSWAATVEDLIRAERLAEAAKEDRALAEEAAEALTAIRRDRARAVKIAAMYDCNARLDGLLEYYSRRSSRTVMAYSNFVTSFAPVAAKVDRLVVRYGKDDPEIGPAVASLADLVASIRADLR